MREQLSRVANLQGSAFVLIEQQVLYELITNLEDSYDIVGWIEKKKGADSVSLGVGCIETITEMLTPHMVAFYIRETPSSPSLLLIERVRGLTSDGLYEPIDLHSKPLYLVTTPNPSLLARAGLEHHLQDV